MKILFLDVDGVLNSLAYCATRGVPPVQLEAVDAWHLDPAAVLRLNELIEVTGAKVVLSSDWRMAPEKPGMVRTEAALRRRGATFRLHDATPVLTMKQRRDRFGAMWQGTYTPRGFEIQCWLDEHPQVERIAIVDDEPEMEHLMDRLVLTDTAVGLTDEDCSKLVSLLCEN